MESFIIKGSNDRPMLCDLRLSSQKSSKLIVFSHGFKGFKDWGPFNKIGEYFKDHEISFLKFNYSHNGTQLNDPYNFSDLKAFGHNNLSKELDDLGCVLDWIELNFKHNMFQEIILMGHSRGAGISILKAAQDDRVSKVISLASVCDFHERIPVKKIAVWKSKGVAYVYNGRTNQQMPIYYQFYEDLQNNRTNLSIYEMSKQLLKPVLIIHGTQDDTVDISHARKLNEWLEKSKTLIIENTNHVFGSSHPFCDKTLPEELVMALDRSVEFMEE